MFCQFINDKISFHILKRENLIYKRNLISVTFYNYWQWSNNINNNKYKYNNKTTINLCLK